MKTELEIAVAYFYDRFENKIPEGNYNVPNKGFYFNVNVDKNGGTSITSTSECHAMNYFTIKDSLENPNNRTYWNDLQKEERDLLIDVSERLLSGPSSENEVRIMFNRYSKEFNPHDRFKFQEFLDVQYSGWPSQNWPLELYQDFQRTQEKMVTE